MRSRRLRTSSVSGQDPFWCLIGLHNSRYFFLTHSLSIFWRPDLNSPSLLSLLMTSNLCSTDLTFHVTTLALSTPYQVCHLFHRQEQSVGTLNSNHQLLLVRVEVSIPTISTQSAPFEQIGGRTPERDRADLQLICEQPVANARTET